MSEAVQTNAPRSMQAQALTAFLITGVFLLGTDNLVIGAIASDIANATHSTVEAVTWGISLYSGAYGAGALLLAPAADLIGRRAMIICAALIFSATSFLIATATGIQAFLVFRFVSGLAAAALGPNLWATANHSFSGPRRASVTSWMMAAFNLATVVGVPLGLLVASLSGWNSFFWALGFLSFGVAAGFYFVGDKGQAKQSFSLSAHFGNIGTALRANSLLYLGMLCGSASYLTVYPFLTEWQGDQSKGAHGSVLTVYFLLIGLAGFLGSLVAPKLMKRQGALGVTRIFWTLRPVVVVAVLVAEISLRQPLGFFLVLALWTFATGTGNSSFMVYMGSRGGKIVSSVMALTNTSIFLGFTAGSFAGSLLWGAYHSITLNTTTAVGLALAGAGLLAVAGRKKSVPTLAPTPTVGAVPEPVTAADKEAQ